MIRETTESDLEEVFNNNVLNGYYEIDKRIVSCITNSFINRL